MNPDARPESGRHLPGELGIWIFIIGDMMVFGLFFMVFLYYRNMDIASFNAAQELLNQNLGAINTIFLLTSSWFVATALYFLRRQRTDLASRLFFFAILCGVGFGGVKYIEWSAKISEGHTITSHDFFMYYYIFTGIHMLHVIIGMGVLTFMLLKARKGHCETDDITTYESGGVFWHMVDLLWIVLFPLFYLVR